MNLSLKLFRYLWAAIFLLCSFSVGAKLFPKNFHSEYQLLQKSNNLGRVIVDFNQKNNQYEIKAITKAEHNNYEIKLKSFFWWRVSFHTLLMNIR
jgi:hypothetical protein